MKFSIVLLLLTSLSYFTGTFSQTEYPGEIRDAGTGDLRWSSWQFPPNVSRIQRGIATVDSSIEEPMVRNSGVREERERRMRARQGQAGQIEVGSIGFSPRRTTEALRRSRIVRRSGTDIVVHYNIQNPSVIQIEPGRNINLNQLLEVISMSGTSHVRHFERNGRNSVIVAEYPPGRVNFESLFPPNYRIDLRTIREGERIKLNIPNINNKPARRQELPSTNPASSEQRVSTLNPNFSNIDQIVPFNEGTSNTKEDDTKVEKKEGKSVLKKIKNVFTKKSRNKDKDKGKGKAPEDEDV